MHEKGDEGGARDTDTSRAPGTFFYSFPYSILMFLRYRDERWRRRGGTSAGARDDEDMSRAPGTFLHMY
jgi:hypothetical protein